LNVPEFLAFLQDQAPPKVFKIILSYLFRNFGDRQATPGVPDTTSEARPTCCWAEAWIFRGGAQRQSGTKQSFSVISISNSGWSYHV